MQLQSTSMRKRIVRGILSTVVIVSLMVLPSLVFGQNPGDNPDAEPQAVPLDPGMSLLLIAVGSFLAVKVMRRGLSSAQPQAVSIKA